MVVLFAFVLLFSSLQCDAHTFYKDLLGFLECFTAYLFTYLGVLQMASVLPAPLDTERIVLPPTELGSLEVYREDVTPETSNTIAKMQKYCVTGSDQGSSR